VLLVDDLEATDVAALGPAVQALASFPQGVNVGFMQVLDRASIRLRVYERGAGETLACGTGACAAAVAGMQLGLLDPDVSVQTQGGSLRIQWDGGSSPVRMAGPATTVFTGEIDIPERP
jgi:diaminopimelate epimerase